VGLWKKDLNEYNVDILLRGFGLERLIEQLQITIITPGSMEMNNLPVEYIGVYMACHDLHEILQVFNNNITIWKK
jgi:hypothetical protein